jgi:hypothetical protein
MSTRDYRRVAEVFVKASSVTGYVVGPDDFETLAMNAANGDAEAVMMLRHVAVAVEQIEPSHPCLSCHRPVAETAYWVVGVVTDDGRRRASMSNAICPTCAHTHQQAMQRLMTSLREFWPDIERIKVTHPTGGTA